MWRRTPRYRWKNVVFHVKRDTGARAAGLAARIAFVTAGSLDFPIPTHAHRQRETSLHHAAG